MKYFQNILANPKNYILEEFYKIDFEAIFGTKQMDVKNDAQSIQKEFIQKLDLLKEKSVYTQIQTQTEEKLNTSKYSNNLIEMFDSFLGILQNQKDFKQALQNINILFLNQQNLFLEQYYLKNLLRTEVFILLQKDQFWKKFQQAVKNEQNNFIIDEVNKFNKDSQKTIRFQFDIHKYNLRKKDKKIFDSVKILQKLQESVEKNNLEDIKPILEQMPFLIYYEFHEHHGKNIINIAVEYKNYEIYKYLNEQLDGKAHSIQDRKLKTPIFIAVENADYDFTKYLIEQGSDINQVNKNDNFLLFKSVVHKSPQITDLLLQNGANINQKNIYGQTAFMKALSKFRVKSIDQFIQRKELDLEKKDNYGQTAIFYSCYTDRHKKYGNKTVQQILYGLKYLLSQNVDRNIVNNSGYDLAGTCCIMDSYIQLEYLIKNKQSIDHINSKGDNIFTLSIKYESINCLKLLMQQEDLQIITQNNQDRNCIDIVVEKNDQELVNIVFNFLIQKKCYEQLTQKIVLILERKIEVFNNLIIQNKEFGNCLTQKFQNDEQSFIEFLDTINNFEQNVNDDTFVLLYTIKNINFIKTVCNSKYWNILDRLLKLYPQADLDMRLIYENINDQFFKSYTFSTLLQFQDFLEYMINYQNEKKQYILIILLLCDEKKTIDRLLQIQENKKILYKQHFLQNDIFGFSFYDYIIYTKQYQYLNILNKYLDNRIVYQKYNVKIILNEKRQIQQETQILKTKLDKNLIESILNDQRYKKLCSMFQQNQSFNVQTFDYQVFGIKTYFVDTEQLLKQSIDHLKSQYIIGIDAEHNFDAERTQQHCSLVQIATLDAIYVFDCLKLWNVLEQPFKEIFQSTQILKIFHGCSSDISLLYHQFGIVVNHFVDTQIIHELIYKEQSKGLNYLASKLLQFELDKTLQKSNWSIRPIPKIMLNYCQIDAIILHPLLYQYYIQNKNFDKILDKTLKKCSLKYQQPHFDKITKECEIKLVEINQRKLDEENTSLFQLKLQQSIQ